MEPGAADPGLVARLAGALEGREEVLEAYLFGSRARGRQRPESDVDVASMSTRRAPRTAAGATGRC